MSRVSTDAAMGWTPRDSRIVVALPATPEEWPPGGFDRLLMRAQEGAKPPEAAPPDAEASPALRRDEEHDKGPGEQDSAQPGGPREASSEAEEPHPANDDRYGREDEDPQGDGTGAVAAGQDAGTSQVAHSRAGKSQGKSGSGEDAPDAAPAKATQNAEAEGAVWPAEAGEGEPATGAPDDDGADDARRVRWKKPGRAAKQHGAKPATDGAAGEGLAAQPGETAGAAGAGPSEEDIPTGAGKGEETMAGGPSAALDERAAQTGARRAGPRPATRGPGPTAASESDFASADAVESPPSVQTAPRIDSQARAEAGAMPGAPAPAASPAQPIAMPSQATHVDSPGVRAAKPGAAEGQLAGTAESEAGDPAERVRFVQRVARAFESATERGGHLRMRLHPPGLGSLRLDLTVRSGVLSARLETETEAARNLLLENLATLRDRLAEHQIKVERFDVHWQGQSQDGPWQRPDDPTRWQAPAPRPGTSPIRQPRPAASDEPAGRAPARPSPGNSFDVVI